MNRVVTRLAGAAAIGIAMTVTSAVFAAEPIEGNWKTESGESAKISKCGSAFCIKLTSGEYSGKRIGRLSGKGKLYSGTITDPTDDKQYSGKATVSSSSMKLKGCALKIFCKTQNWKKL